MSQLYRDFHYSQADLVPIHRDSRGQEWLQLGYYGMQGVRQDCTHKVFQFKNMKQKNTLEKKQKTKQAEVQKADTKLQTNTPKSAGHRDILTDRDDERKQMIQ